MRSPLWAVWQEQVKEFFSHLHGHQSKTLALFVVGVIKARSLVIPVVAEELLAESEAKTSSIERRLERFLSNERIETKKTWDALLTQLLPYFRRGPLRLVIDLTSYEEHAQVIYIGLLQHSRVLPLAWKVMPGWQSWEQGLWEYIEELFKRLAPHIRDTECTVPRSAVLPWSPCVTSTAGITSSGLVPIIPASPTHLLAICCHLVGSLIWSPSLASGFLEVFGYGRRSRLKRTSVPIGIRRRKKLCWSFLIVPRVVRACVSIACGGVWNPPFRI